MDCAITHLERKIMLCFVSSGITCNPNPAYCTFHGHPIHLSVCVGNDSRVSQGNEGFQARLRDALYSVILSMSQTCTGWSKVCGHLVMIAVCACWTSCFSPIFCCSNNPHCNGKGFHTTRRRGVQYSVSFRSGLCAQPCSSIRSLSNPCLPTVCRSTTCWWDAQVT